MPHHRALLLAASTAVLLTGCSVSGSAAPVGTDSSSGSAAHASEAPRERPRTPRRPAVTVTVTASPTAIPDAAPPPAPPPAVVVAPAPDPTVTRSGTLTVVTGNEGEGYCLALDTPAGLYTVGSSTPAYDATVTTTSVGAGDDEVVRAETGMHIHGRGSLGMAATYGQHVVLRGYLSGVTGTECSRYYDLGVTEIVSVG